MFYEDKGPRNRHLSGVIFIRDIRAWSVARLAIVYIPNPWARYSLTKTPKVFEELLLNEGNVMIKLIPPKISLHKLLGLWEAWPDDPS